MMKFLLVAFLVSAWGVEGCDKNWIKFMVVNACSYAKRGSHRGPYSEISLDLVREKFERLFGEEEWEELTKQSDEMEKASAEQLPDSLDLFNFEMGLDPEKNIRRRQIKEIVKKCCRSLCTVQDFKGACY